MLKHKWSQFVETITLLAGKLRIKLKSKHISDLGIRVAAMPGSAPKKGRMRFRIGGKLITCRYWRGCCPVSGCLILGFYSR